MRELFGYLVAAILIVALLVGAWQFYRNLPRQRQLRAIEERKRKIPPHGPKGRRSDIRPRRPPPPAPTIELSNAIACGAEDRSASRASERPSPRDQAISIRFPAKGGTFAEAFG